MTAGLLPGADRDLVTILAKRIDRDLRGRVAEHEGHRDEGQRRSGIAVVVRGRREVTGDQTFDRVLVSIGRQPNSGDARARQDEGRRSTSAASSSIDESAADGRADHLRDWRRRRRADARAQGVARRARRGRRDRRRHNVAFEPRRFRRSSSPIPEIAWAGLTETEAEKQGIKVAVAQFPWGASGRAISIGRTDGVTKLVIDPQTERVLGVGICGPGAGELIAEGVLAIEMGATAKDMAMTIHPHPTLSETVMEAAEVFFGHATHVYRPKRSS